MGDRSLRVLPSRHQAPLPLERLILTEPPDAEAVPMDVLFVGGGPAGLAGAIELAKLVKADNDAGGTLGEIQIGVLEKAGALGEHSLSGSVVNPIAMRGCRAINEKAAALSGFSATRTRHFSHMNAADLIVSGCPGVSACAM